MNAIIGMSGLLARDRARRRAARVRLDDRPQRRGPAHDHQRHPRLLQDRGRTDGPRARAVRRPRMRRGGRRPDRTDRRSARVSRSPTGSSPGRRRPRWATTSRLRQILLNLLNNAVKFTDEGEIAVHVEQAESPEPDRIAFHVAIRDTGIGIPPDRIDRALPVVHAGRRVDQPPVRRDGPRPRDQPPARRADGRDRDGREQRRPRRGQHVPRDVRGGRDGHDADRAAPGRIVRGAPSAHRRRQRDEPPADDRAPVRLGRRDDDRVLRRGGARRARAGRVRRRDRSTC